MKERIFCTKLKLAAAAAVCLAGLGCSDFLDVVPLNQPTTDNFYHTDGQLNMALSAAYSTLGNRTMFCAAWGFGLHLNLLTDDVATPEASHTPFYNFVWDATTDNISNAWKNLYQGIYRANLVIENAPIADEASDEVKARTAAEARFLRSLYYFYLVNLWGAVPIIETSFIESYDIPRSSAAAVWAFIESDLLAAINSGALRTDQGGGHATIGAARAFLGKVYLYQNKYGLAAVQLDAVAQNSVYGLLDDVGDIWAMAGENSQEMIFEIMFDKDAGGVNPYYDDGSDASEGTLWNISVGPLQLGFWENITVLPALYNAYGAGDLRQKAFIFADGDSSDMFEGGVWNQADNKGEYGIRKGISTNGSGWPDGFEENWPLIRYADVLLMLAECLVMQDPQDLAGAQTHVNRVRARAFGDDTHALTFADRASAMAAIKLERRLELCFESHRYFDLVRWGDAEVALSSGPTRQYTQAKRWWPIPAHEVDVTNGQIEKIAGN